MDAHIKTFEASMSLLTLAIAHIERNPPRSPDDLTRLQLLVSRIDSATTRAHRAIILEKVNA